MQPPILYAHPFSSYCQKVLTALYENATPFTLRQLDKDGTAPMEELAARWPLKRFPMLVDREETVVEATIIIEHLQLAYPGRQVLIPQDSRKALPVRMMDRFFDNYIMTPVQTIVLNHCRAEGDRDPTGVAGAREMLETAYRWIDGRLATATEAADGREIWAAGAQFSLADCAAAPSLFYADWVKEIDDRFPHLRAYRARLLGRPSYARCVDEARPYRQFFPLPVPDRD
jgi:glutathione S-transferase